MYLKNILIFIFLFIAHFSSAVNYYFRHYTNEDGLSHNTVYCGTQDQTGFMWFGTKDGLNRFDGHTFKVYRHQKNNIHSLKANYVTALWCDQDGILWIGTSRGVNYYNGINDQFNNLDSLVHCNQEVQDIKEDTKKNIWILSSDGLYKYNKQKRTIQFYSANNYFVPRRICITASGDLWVSAQEGCLYKYNYNKDHFEQFNLFSEQQKRNVGTISIADAGSYGLLIGTEMYGFMTYNPYTGKMSSIVAKDHNNTPIYVRAIMRYSEDEFWIGTESGLFFYNLKTDTFVDLEKNKYNPYSIGDNAIYSLTKDKEGGVWASTYFRGISYLASTCCVFEKIFDQGKAGDIKGDIVREIVQDRNNNLWIGTEDHGLNKLDPQTRECVNFIPAAKQGGIASKNIHGLMIDGSHLWLGYFNSGVDILDVNTQRVIKHYDKNSHCGLNTDFIVKIFKTKDGTILLGTADGLYKYDEVLDHFFPENDLAAHTFIYCMCQDHNNTLWIGTLGSGIFFRTIDGKIGHIVSNESSPNAITSDAIIDVFEDSNNRLWFGTRGDGLFEYHPQSNTFTQYSSENGFPSNFTYKILEDAHNQLWITTSNGIVCFNPDKNIIKRYTKSDGITNNQFNYNSGYRDRFGKMYFGTIDGLTTFTPELIKGKNTNVPVCITGFQTLDKELKLQNKSITFAKQVQLSYKQSSFSIHFAILSYASPETNDYSYMLQGFDKKWSNASTYNSAHYTNLSPGTYIFRLKASNKNAIWNGVEKQLIIVIKNPPWKTLWAYLGYATLALLLLYLAFHFYNQRIKIRDELRFEKMESVKHEEILNAKIDFFTQIAHEIRTPLTLIKGSLDRIAKSSNKIEQTQNNLVVMDKNTTRLLDLSDQLLDFRKTEQEGLKLNFTNININQLILDTYYRFTPISEDRHIKFEFSPLDYSVNVIADQEAVTKILSNLFSNALKFATSSVKVELAIDETQDLFSIRVNSDGEAIPEKMSEKIFEPFFQYKDPKSITFLNGTGIGLFLARSLAELHRGRLYLDLSLQPINSFIVELPQNQNISIHKDTHQSHSSKEQLLYSCHKKDNLHTILIVEDEIDMLHFIEEELLGSYNVLKAKNGQEALQLLESNNVHLIISDIMMPIMDGFQLCKIVKSALEYQHIPLILLTAKHNSQSQIEGLELGADAYIRKPFTSEYLLAKISNLLKTREQLIESYNSVPYIHTISLGATKESNEFLTRLNDIILSRLTDPKLGVDCLASILGISTSSLYRKIMLHCNTKPNEFIRVVRLKKAAELLVEEHKSIKEVTYLTGFSSPSYFSACFSKQFGMKPSEFIKKE